MKRCKNKSLANYHSKREVRLFEILFSSFNLINWPKALIILILITLGGNSFAQNTDNVKVVSHFGGAATVTNNGLSFIPTFSLGKPAAIFDLSMGRKRVSFDPQFRFALDGKPWSFIFWWRYKAIRTNNISLTIGAHPAVMFKTVSTTNNGVSEEIIVAQHFLAAEVAPNYFLNKNVSIGIYYLYSRGLQPDGVQNTNFFTLNCNLSHIKLPKEFYLKFTPQFYYLKMDKPDGFYFTSALTLAHQKWPISISSVINKVIQTDITASKDFVWNVSIIYSFSNKYVTL